MHVQASNDATAGLSTLAAVIPSSLATTDVAVDSTSQCVTLVSSCFVKNQDASVIPKAISAYPINSCLIKRASPPQHSDLHWRKGNWNHRLTHYQCPVADATGKDLSPFGLGSYPRTRGSTDSDGRECSYQLRRPESIQLSSTVNR